MKVTALGVLLGIMLLHQFAALPPVSCAWLLLACVPLTFFCKVLRLPLAVGCGFLWALYQAHAALHPGLDPALEGRDLVVTGVVASLPEARGYATRFLFDIERVRIAAATGRPVPERVRLNWYREVPQLALGQRWRLTVRLKRPWGFMNPAASTTRVGCTARGSAPPATCGIKRRRRGWRTTLSSDRWGVSGRRWPTRSRPGCRTARTSA